MIRSLKKVTKRSNTFNDLNYIQTKIIKSPMRNNELKKKKERGIFAQNRSRFRGRDLYSSIYDDT